MARPSDEFVLAWNSLIGAAEGCGWRTIPITAAGPCVLAAGRRFPGNEEALLAGFSSASIAAAEKLPEGQGFNVQRVDPHNGSQTWLALTRRSSGSIELFLAMVCDVADALDAAANSDEDRLLRVFLGRVRAWQEFMRKGAQALSPEAEIGLIGEITLLSAIIEAGVPAAIAIKSWVGPLDGIQDFELGTGALEVKATLAAAGFPARIGSLEQLDDSVRQPLFIVGARLRQAASGKTLPDFVCAQKAAINGDAEAERLLAERLLAAGYLDVHADGYSRRFDLAGMRVIEVGDVFPRLTSGCVPVGILRAMYEIDLEKVPSENIGTKEALKKLGAL
ncbi:MAG: PD-(D/E)XK motif protein [Porticoccaceae bacterium]